MKVIGIMETCIQGRYYSMSRTFNAALLPMWIDRKSDLCKLGRRWDAKGNSEVGEHRGCKWGSKGILIF
jgi:hypothetical protein